ncbi:MAG: hypothetical protein DMF73_06055 [Acidobacteria bacterium]|nr:MAG: hypothetical protein DMF73_06055 [Acidobacteriota bacterium]
MLRNAKVKTRVPKSKFDTGRAARTFFIFSGLQDVSFQGKPAGSFWEAPVKSAEDRIVRRLFEIGIQKGDSDYD